MSTRADGGLLTSRGKSSGVCYGFLRSSGCWLCECCSPSLVLSPFLSRIFFLWPFPTPCLFASLTSLAAPGRGGTCEIASPTPLTGSANMFVPSRSWLPLWSLNTFRSSPVGSQEQTGGELCTVGFLGETPDADNQEKLLRLKVRVRVRRAKKHRRRDRGGGKNMFQGKK